jgi:NADH-quinone oxidoreductase subunit H
MELALRLVEVLGYVVPVLISVAFLTLAERKVIGATQGRIGPNVIGIYGLGQPFADGLKLFVKETVLPNNANLVVFLIAPMVTFILAVMGWAVIPISSGVMLSDVELGVLYLFAVSSLGVYGIIMSGWASNSKYAFLGALRSAAQMISYEVSMGLIILSVLMCAGSMNLTMIVRAQESVWYVVPLLPLAVMFFISSLAETNRHPFDLPEAEAELVAGYNVEYSAFGFALFFIGEYANMILMSTMTVLLFLGGWLAPFGTTLTVLTLIPGSIWFGLKLSVILLLFILVRAAYPRYRYDQLMRLGWKVFLPLSLGWVILVSSILVALDWA